MKDLQALSPANAATMTSREIADLTGKEHKNVMADIRSMLDQLGGTSAEFSAELPDSYGRPQPAFRLPKRETLILVSGYNVTVRARIIDRWQEMEDQQEMQRRLSPANGSPLLRAASEDAMAVHSFLKTIGLDQNAAAISANQVAINLHGVNLLELSGNTRLLAANQEAQALTPTELGALMGGVSARQVNKLLETSGLQKKAEKEWVPLPAAEGLYRLFDTGKKHGSGVPVTQLKWYPAAAERIKRAA